MIYSGDNYVNIMNHDALLKDKIINLHFFFLKKESFVFKFEKFSWVGMNAWKMHLFRNAYTSVVHLHTPYSIYEIFNFN